MQINKLMENTKEKAGIMQAHLWNNLNIFTFFHTSNKSEIFESVISLSKETLDCCPKNRASHPSLRGDTHLQKLQFGSPIEGQSVRN